ncbi:MAG: CoA transferase [Pseudomonadota bacterium]
MKQPLEGIRVLECGIYHAGPGASAILGDLGADVIKIEQPGLGDPIRQQKKIGRIQMDLPGGRNLFCEGANRNKKSVTINLKSKKGQEIAHHLVTLSDVFLTNIRRKAIVRMNMTYPTLSQINPQLIYAYVSAFGPEGPDKDRGGFDYLGQARSGFMFSMGDSSLSPMTCQFGIIDQATAIIASQQIITALYMRERFGMGQEVHVSILGSTMFLLYFNILIAQMGGVDVPPHVRNKEHPLRNYYRCGDGRWIMLTLAPPERFWGTFCLALGHPELEKDPRFNTEDKKLENAEQLVAVLDDIFATRSLDEWLRIFGEHDIFCCGVNSPMDLAHDPQIMENRYLIDFEHPTMGKVKIPGYPAHFSKSRAQTTHAAPELGEHTEEVLRDLCHYTRDEIRQLREDGVI